MYLRSCCSFNILAVAKGFPLKRPTGVVIVRLRKEDVATSKGNNTLTCIKSRKLLDSLFITLYSHGHCSYF